MNYDNSYYEKNEQIYAYWLSGANGIRLIVPAAHSHFINRSDQHSNKNVCMYVYSFIKKLT